MTYKYKTKGVCASHIELELENDTIKNVRFIGGCSGNTQGVAALVKGMKVEEAIERLEGIRCGFKPTSCPDQLAKALKEAQN
ncbi:MAG: TIGR03905 family TSCPD domain-containing protein [Clostridia bacterium]|nr:TIGR03905 family TSCPD domain-containing protein [Clostridia bacterium]